MPIPNSRWLSVVAGGLIVASLLAGSIWLRPSVSRAAPQAGSCALQRQSLSADPEESSLLLRINDYRASNSLSPLTISTSLTAAAAWKSADMGANRYFAHDDLSRTWAQRFIDCGYGSTPTIAENLAAGNEDGAATFEQWRTSAGHNANLLSSSMRSIGVARAYTAGSPYGWYWTADFGALLETAAPAAPSTTVAPSPARTASPAPTAAPVSAGAQPAASATPSVPAPPSSGPASALGIGSTAIVSGTGDCLRVHDAPALASAETACLSDGSAFVVADGPVAADGFTWWKLGALGWAVDRYLTAIP